MNEQQRELKKARDKRYREKKKTQATPGEATAAGVLDPKPRWNPERHRREVIDILRTEIRLRHRHAAGREIETLKARVVRRFDDPAFYDRFALETFQEIEEFASCTRQELYEAAGETWHEGCAEYGDNQ